MKKKVLFFGKLFIVTLLLFVFCFGVVMPQYTGNYQASMVDKAARLRSVEGPKIVLIGNSNLAFGMDSQMLEEAFSMPVVNMGLHGGVGNVFNEQAARLNVTPGDIYVVCHSNYDDTDAIKNPELAWITIENHFELYKLIRPKDWWDMIRAYPTYLRKCLGQWRNESGNQETNNCYRRSAFNAYGDVYYPRPQSEEGIDFSPVAIHHINETKVIAYETFWLLRRKCRVKTFSRLRQKPSALRKTISIPSRPTPPISAACSITAMRAAIGAIPAMPLSAPSRI